MTALIRTVSRLTGEAALQLVQAAARETAALGLTASIAVVDDSGQAIASYSMDGSAPQSAAVARNKAYTAIAYGMASEEFMHRARQFGDDGAAMLTAAVPGTMLLGGGVPVVHDDTVVGAVGVSGGTGDQDKGIASAAIQAVFGPGPTEDRTQE